VSRQQAKRGEWKPEYPRDQVRVSNIDATGVIRNGLPATPYLPSDIGRRNRLLYALGIKHDDTKNFITTED
jgi:hypothetical protein